MPPNQNTSNLYPFININHPENPNRFYAFPLIGFLVKVIILIPIWIWLAVLNIGGIFVSVINSFVVLFSGNYWNSAYNYNLGLMRLTIKVIYFIEGLTDKYPGFSRTVEEFNVDIPYPQQPSKFFAFPLIGGLLRLILLIPYSIYQNVITNAAYLGVIFSFLPVLFMDKYPESTYELARDSVRVSQATFVYTTGLSDKYPSFHISMNHKVIKIILIVVAALWILAGTFRDIYSAAVPLIQLSQIR